MKNISSDAGKTSFVRFTISTALTLTFLPQNLGISNKNGLFWFLKSLAIIYTLENSDPIKIIKK